MSEPITDKIRNQLSPITGYFTMLKHKETITDSVKLESINKLLDSEAAKAEQCIITIIRLLEELDEKDNDGTGIK